MSSNRAAVSACIRRVTGVAPWGARSSSLPGYLRLSASSRRLLLVFISVWLGLAALLTARSSASLPLLRSGRGLGRCRLLPLPGIGLAAPSLCSVCAAAAPWPPRPLARREGCEGRDAFRRPRNAAAHAAHHQRADAVHTQHAQELRVLHQAGPAPNLWRPRLRIHHVFCKFSSDGTEQPAACKPRARACVRAATGTAWRAGRLGTRSHVRGRREPAC